ncbi:hypothetical protein Bca4012_100764 [Brassica carinata]
MEKRFATQRKEEEEEATQILTIYQIRCFVTYSLFSRQKIQSEPAFCRNVGGISGYRDRFELLETMSVRSKSLISFALGIEDYEVGLLGDDHVVEIDAPRLEHMSLCDHLSGGIIIHSIAPSALVKIDVNFDGKDRYALLYQDYDYDDDDDSNSKRTMIRNFLTRISTVCGMEISSVTLQVIHDYSKWEPLPQFSDLSWLNASFLESFWELLPTFLCCCPNLHTLGFEFDKEECPIKLSSVPPCFVSSLKYVELSTRVTTRSSSQMKLARYFLRNCAALKKLTLSGNFGDDIIKKIKKIPRRSRRCIIVTG